MIVSHVSSCVRLVGVFPSHKGQPEHNSDAGPGKPVLAHEKDGLWRRKRNLQSQLRNLGLKNPTDRALVAEGEGPSPPAGPTAPLAAISTIYESPREATKAVCDNYQYWTVRLTDTSLQLSFAIIAANWAVFGSVASVLSRFWSELSVALVIIGLGLSLAGANWMGESLRRRIDYAESNPSAGTMNSKTLPERAIPGHLQVRLNQLRGGCGRLRRGSHLLLVYHS